MSVRRCAGVSVQCTSRETPPHYYSGQAAHTCHNSSWVELQVGVVLNSRLRLTSGSRRPARLPFGAERVLQQFELAELLSCGLTCSWLVGLLPCCCSGDAKLLLVAAGEPDYSIMVWRWYSSKVSNLCPCTVVTWTVQAATRRAPLCAVFCQFLLASRQFGDVKQSQQTCCPCYADLFLRC